MPRAMPLEEARLNAPSRRLFEELVAVAPEIAGAAQMELAPDAEACCIVIDTISPTGDPSRRLGLWMEAGTEPSVGFGPWHTHAGVWVSYAAYTGSSASIAELVAAILRDEFVIFEHVAGPHDGHRDVLDLRRSDALVEYFTERYAAERIRILSWTGAADREVGITDL